MKNERTISMASPMEAYESERLNASYPVTVLWNPMEKKLSLRIHIQCVLLWSLMRTLQRQGPPLTQRKISVIPCVPYGERMSCKNRARCMSNESLLQPYQFFLACKKRKKNRQHAGSLPLGWKFAAESEVCRCSKFAAGVKLLISYL